MRPGRSLFLAAVTLAACNALSGVDDLDFTAVPCTGDLTCQAPDACKVGHCAEGVCAFSPLPDGVAPAQVPGDCQHLKCAGGEPAAEADPTDSDDGNVCTEDACKGGTPSHVALDDVQCGQNGVCRDGECVISCARAGDPCEETPPNPCTDDSCDVSMGVCVHVPLDGQLLDTGSPLDCEQLVCVRDQAQTVPADSEVPDDSSPCTKDVCRDGVPHNDGDPALSGTACGVNGTCNDSGACIGCNSPADCPGIDADCQHRTCEGGVCGVDYEADGTLVAGQVVGDCSKIVCDGAGQTKTVTDGGDVPADEGNPCTSESCSGSVPVHPPVAIGTLCNVSGGKVCNATGQCVQCNMPVDCLLPGLCKTATCSANQCGSTSVPDGQDPAGQCNDDGPASCDNDGQCNGQGQCRKYAAGTVCTTATCAGGMQTGAGTCDGGGTCNAGAATSCSPYACAATTCKTSCNSNADCAAGYSCNTSSHICGLANGSGCGSGGACASNVCQDGVCCNVDCPGACQECNLSGFVGTCHVVPSCQQGGCLAGSACNGGSATNCLKLDGQTCQNASECLGGTCTGFPKKCSGDPC